MDNSTILDLFKSKPQLNLFRIGLGWLAFSMAFLGGTSCFQMQFCWGQTDSPNEPSQNQSPLWIVGSIVDEAGQPIANAGVTISVHEPGNSRFGPRPVLKKFETKTNEEGQYRFDFAKASPTHPKYFVKVVASTERCWEHDEIFRKGEFFEAKEIPPIQMREGRTIKGKLVAKDSAEATLQSPKLLVFASFKDDKFVDTFIKVFELDESGEFECLVPPDCPIAMAATADGYAIARANLDATDTEVGQIELPDGVALKGIMRNRANQPMPNVVVHLVERDCLFLENTCLIIRSSVVTDEKGRFRFPAHRGKCTVSVGSRGDNTFGEHLFPDPINQPLVLPKEIDLRSNDPLPGIALSEVPPQSLTGRVFYEDGEPAKGIVVDAATAGNQFVGQTKTDNEGKYQIVIPKGTVRFGLRVLGGRDKAGNYLIADPKEHPLAFRSTLQSIFFDQVEDDLENIDWTLKQVRQPGK